jgi:hypothetical protein
MSHIDFLTEDKSLNIRFAKTKYVNETHLYIEIYDKLKNDCSLDINLDANEVTQLIDFLTNLDKDEQGD